jgi:putative endonuclease
MSHFVYILQSEKDGRYYIGETRDVVARLAFHNAGLQRSTKGRIPFRLVYQEQHTDRLAALKRELEKDEPFFNIEN